MISQLTMQDTQRRSSGELLSAYRRIVPPIHFFVGSGRAKRSVDGVLVPRYRGTMPEESRPVAVDRVQLGVRMERNLVKVLKGLAEFENMTLGQLLEKIVLH